MTTEEGKKKLEILEIEKQLIEIKLVANGTTRAAITALETEISALRLGVDLRGKSTASIQGETGARQSSTSAIDRQTSALEAQNAAIERANAATQKSIDLENKRRGVDASGFSANKDGTRTVAATDIGTLTGVAAFLKSAGVSDDAAARKLALEFSDGQGNIPYFGNAGQKKYGGASSTLSFALLKAAETYTFGNDQAAAKTPSAIPAQNTTQTVNINIGGRTTAVNVASGSDAAALTSVLRQLESGRGTAS